MFCGGRSVIDRHDDGMIATYSNSSGARSSGAAKSDPAAFMTPVPAVFIACLFSLVAKRDL